MDDYLPVEASSQPTLLRLKHATADAHRRVEAAVGLFNPRERGGYARYLGRLLGLYEPLEPLLERVLGGVPGRGWVACRKTRALQRDLTWLEVDMGGLPRCNDLPCLPTRAYALGGLYVVEGATLGGRAQLRMLGDSLGVSRAAGAAFLGSYGEDVDARWQTTRSTIVAAAIRDRAEPEILAGACATFEAFDRWLRTA